MPVRMKALKRQYYAARVIEAGELFDADNDTHALVLTTVGNAARVTDDEPKRPYRRREIRSEL